MIVSAWDTASRTGEGNDPSNNTVVGRRVFGDFVVLDNWECKVSFDRLLPIVLERYRLLTAQFRNTPVYLCIEEASSGLALCDILESQFPGIPLLKARAVKSKIIRAESVTPFTSAGSVKLLRGDWNQRFITDLSNFPASDRDHAVDSFCHAMRAFLGTGNDFRTPNLLPVSTVLEPEYLDDDYQRIDPELDRFDRGGWW